MRVSSAIVLAGLVVTACAGDERDDGQVALEEASESETALDDPTPGAACDALDLLVDSDRMLADLESLVEIAAQHGGNRASGLEGFEASHAWVKGELEAAGYVAQTSGVEFNFAMIVEAGTLSRTAPDSLTFTHGEDFVEFSFSAPGDVEAPLAAIDLQLGLGNDSTSACDPEDFAGFTPGHIALVQRGGCTFVTKVVHAENAGASGIVIFNQGDTPEPQRNDVHPVGLFPSSLGDFTNIPAVFASYDLGVELAMKGEVSVHLVTDTIAEVREAENLIVETDSGNSDEVVMFGAHLDSVVNGPGINDNGTGSIALLELARLVAECEPERRIRFAWWAAEEFGLWGSNAYVAGLSDHALARLLFYLNFDMIGSPNAGHFVHDGDGSRFGQPGPAGSDTLEQFFHTDFEAANLPLLETRFDLRSDYAAFHGADVATGGLFTGAEGIKTPEQAELFGGLAGEPYDPCYHRVCDTVENIDRLTYEHMTRSMARALQFFGIDGMGFTDARERPTRAQLLAAHAHAHAGHRGCNHAMTER